MPRRHSASIVVFFGACYLALRFITPRAPRPSEVHNSLFKTSLTPCPKSRLLAGGLLIFTLSVMCSSEVMAVCSSPSFAAPQAFLTRVRGVAAGDFNGDGRMDVVAAGDFITSVHVMLNNGAQGFLAPVNVGTGGWPASIAVGDFNNDLKMDVVTANFNPTNVSILFGDGAGGFAAPVNIAVGDSSFPYVTVGHFNNDQHQDLAVANAGGTVAILLGNGSGGFSGPTSFPVGDRITSIATADFDVDGATDLAIVRQTSNQVSILLGNGSGGFGAAATFMAGSSPSSVLAQDFNTDGKPELAITVTGNMVILANNGDGTFGAPTTFNVSGSSPTTVVSGDFNNDGKYDVAVGHTGGVSVRFGDGAGGFGALTNFAVGLGPTFLAVEDFDGDGSADFAVSSYSSTTVGFLLNNGSGGFKSAASYSTNNDANSVLAKDFNNDGKIDLAVANRNGNTVSVYPGDGSGGFLAALVSSVGPPPISNVSNGPFSLAAGDFNGDNKLDLLTANFTGGSVSILLGDGTGNFSAQKMTISGGGSPQFVLVNDFNLDGKADFALTRNGYFSNITVFYGNGNGTFGGQTDFATSIVNSNVLSNGDLNGDGKTDLVVGSTPGSSFSVLLNNGSGGFVAPTLYTLNANQGEDSVGLIGDFTGDGKADVVVANYMRDMLALFPGNGTGALSSPTFLSVGKSPRGLAAADFNVDGSLDIAVGYINSGAISVALNNGAGAFSTPRHYLGNLLGTFVATADFNSDGLADLATEGIAIFLNTCSATVALPVPSVSISNTSVPEASPNAAFEVTLSAPSADTITVQYQTSSQTAVGGADFQTTAGSVSFAPGETTKPINIPILDDTLNEFTEKFFVSLHHPVNATIRKRQGTGSIVDSDPEPTITINGTSLAEGNSGSTTANFNVVLSSPSGKLIKVTYSTADITATAGSDYQAASNTILKIAAGASSASLSIVVTGDTTVEPDETFSVTISNPVNVAISGVSAVGTIVDDDGIRLLQDTSGPSANQAAALDSLLLVRDPFRVLSIAEWWNLGADPNTRVTIFAVNLNSAEPASAVTISLLDSNSQTHNITSEDVRAVPNYSFTQVRFRLPDSLPAGNCLVTIKAHGQTSNVGTIRIAP
jgi:hypothetical protein